jgi:hypothetical protein
MTIRLLGTRCTMRAVSVPYSAAYLRGAVGIGMSVVFWEVRTSPGKIRQKIQLSPLQLIHSFVNFSQLSLRQLSLLIFFFPKEFFRILYSSRGSSGSPRHIIAELITRGIPLLPRIFHREPRLPIARSTISLMSSGHSDHAYAPPNTQQSTPPSTPMSETAHSGSSIGATMPLVSTSAAGNKNRKIEKQSLEYAIRSGIAGGLAGCAVSSRHLQIPRFCACDVHTDWRFVYRPKLLSHRSTA